MWHPGNTFEFTIFLPFPRVVVSSSCSTCSVKALDLLGFPLWQQIRLSWQTILPRFQTATPQSKTPALSSAPGPPVGTCWQFSLWFSIGLESSSAFSGGNGQWQLQLFICVGLGHSLILWGWLVQWFNCFSQSNLDWVWFKNWTGSWIRLGPIWAGQGPVGSFRLILNKG